ncbi:hypothetical protein ASD11_14310 [Aeromicrobium sp. Root495]|nr:hypothetical protein ASD11_14310 [Aeromicrobium sp. Root495]
MGRALGVVALALTLLLGWQALVSDGPATPSSSERGAATDAATRAVDSLGRGAGTADVLRGGAPGLRQSAQDLERVAAELSVGQGVVAAAGLVSMSGEKARVVVATEGHRPVHVQVQLVQSGDDWRVSRMRLLP